MFLRTVFSSAILALVASASLMADSIPYPSPGTVAPGQTFTAPAAGNIVAYFYDSTATFNEQLGLYVNGTQQGGWALENHHSVMGQAFNFGTVRAGDSLVFALLVADTAYTLFSIASMNPDAVNHTYATSFSGLNNGSDSIPAGTYVGFEDSLVPFSDFNYNDEAFVFTDVPSGATPEPASLWLVSIGVMACAVRARRKQSVCQ